MKLAVSLIVHPWSGCLAIMKCRDNVSLCAGERDYG